MKRSLRNIRWAEKYIRLPEGKFVGKPLKMAEFMKEDFRAIYDNPNGTRRAIISRGRKNAKTTECAIILLLHLCGPEAKANSQLFSAAQSRDQAGILFSLAAKMVRLSPDLLGVVNVRDTAKQLACAEMGTLYRALSADASTAFGLSPILTIHDEAGQIKGPRSALYEALETATAAQEQPLSIIISTQAPTNNDLLSVLIDDALTEADPRTVLRLQFAPDDLDSFSIEAIRAANPAFDVFMNREEVLAMAADAKRMPSREAEYRNLVLNQRVEATSPFISRSTWQGCEGEVVESFDGLPVYGGLDLSATSDLTALVLMAPVNGRFHVKPTFWLPREGLREKAARDRVPYDLWHRDGFLETTPGKSVEYEFVAEYLRGVFDRYAVVQLGFDDWNFAHLKPWLIRAGFPEEEIEAKFVAIRQNYKEMSPALRSLEAGLLQQKIVHDGHPVLSMCAANAVVVSDGKENRMLTKSKSHGRIDGMVALALAQAVAGTYEAPPLLDIRAMIV
jgi:phage terminase large subunit-like protein